MHIEFGETMVGGKAVAHCEAHRLQRRGAGMMHWEPVLVQLGYIIGLIYEKKRGNVRERKAN